MVGQSDVDACIAQAAIRPLSPREVRANPTTLHAHTLTGWPKRVVDGGETYLILWASFNRGCYERQSDHRKFTVERHG